MKIRRRRTDQTILSLSAQAGKTCFRVHPGLVPSGTVLTPRHETLIHPLALAERLIAQRPRPGRLAMVRVFRGRPNPNRHPVPAAANDAQTARWERDPRVTVIRPRHPPHVEIARWRGARPLWFPDGLAARPPRYLPYCHFLDKDDFEASLDPGREDHRRWRRPPSDHRRAYPGPH